MKIIICLIHILFFLKITLIKTAKQQCFEFSCEECNSTEYGTCTKCRDDFRLIDGTCPCSSSDCALCTTGLAGLNICEQCKDGYYSSDKNCYCEVSNCEQCAPDGCLKCTAGYYYNETSKECLKETEENKIQCFDQNCDGCFSDEQGACQSCKEGYELKKGECIELVKADNGFCPGNSYPIGNYCYERCNGIACNTLRGFQWPNLIVFTCPENNCLVCVGNDLLIFSECDNSEVCSGLDGCLNCLTRDECIICQQGYYLLGGKCKKCSEGCSICSSINNCQVCMSGYQLTSSKSCNLTYTFDFNTDLYQSKKIELIPIYYPEEIPKPTTIPVRGTTEPTTSVQNDENSINKISDINIDTTKIDTTTITKNNEITYGSTEINITKIEELLNKINLNSYSIENMMDYNKNKIFLCDKNCLKCYDNTGKCIECNPNYTLKNDKCSLTCSDKNCDSCDFKDGNEKCTKCLPYHELKDNKCNIVCSIEHCSSCSVKNNNLICNYCKSEYYLENNKCKAKCLDFNCDVCSEDGKECLQCNSFTKLIKGKCAKKKDLCISYYNCRYCSDDDGCLECEEGYEVIDKYCSKKKNKKLFIIILIIVFFMFLGIIFFCIYTRRKENSRLRRVNPYSYDIQSDYENNNPYIYNVRNELNMSNSMRPAINKDDLAEEFEAQKRKYNKAKMPCMYCKRKQGTFKLDCGCIVCKDHSNLKDEEKDGQNYKVCLICSKKVDKINAIKYNCNICMQNKSSVTHFQCGCALEVCKNCYIMCKMTNEKCPGCRAKI